MPLCVSNIIQYVFYYGHFLGKSHSFGSPNPLFVVCIFVMLVLTRDLHLSCNTLYLSLLLHSKTRDLFVYCGDLLSS